ncbi:phage holin family protein [Capnocytophaga canimorsus]|uniref:phage holin family protein n=1 Tax=Capnocytophaga canimorsus TaxID=28188 RepID=UPI0028F06482|nr:phage holin family protein [Capnocytophaga canimorsus]MDT9499132.1 phage holin family protein [Capnocytophaga canimorsus]
MKHFAFLNSGIHIKKFSIWLFQDWELYKVFSLAFSIFLSIFTSVSVPFLALLALILIDTRFGIKKWMFKQRNKGNANLRRFSFQNIRSWGIRRVLSKIADYVFILAASVILEMLLEYLHLNAKYDHLHLSTLVAFLLCAVELKSIDENVKTIRGISIISAVLNHFLKKNNVKELYEETIKKNDDDNIPQTHDNTPTSGQ